MLVLTPSERRGAWVLILLFALGSGYDLWRAFAGDRQRSEHEPRPGVPLGTHAPTRDAIDSARAHGMTGTRLGTGAGRRSASGGPIQPMDVNQANVQELDALPGVGPVLAERIVEHRRRYGRFQRAEDLLSVRGIGPRLLERIRPHLIVDTCTGRSCIGQDSTPR